MALLNRRRRPIPRDETKLRDARLFVVATEDTYAPKQYFGFFQNPALHVEVLATKPGKPHDPNAIVTRLMEFAQEYQIGEEDQLWALLDTDHWIEPNHKTGLIHAIQDAVARGYHVAMSNPCFDLWLLLHHENVSPSAEFEGCRAVGERIRKALGEFNKTNLKAEHYPATKVPIAITRARHLDTEETTGLAANYWPDKTGTRVYRLMQSLIEAGLLK